MADTNSVENVKALVDAAVAASRHTKKCGELARSCFNEYGVALAQSQKLAALSNDAIFRMEEDITRRMHLLKAAEECATH